MHRRPHQRLWASDGDPGLTAWLIAVISIVLPVAGLGLCLLGGARLLTDRPDGWSLLGAGIDLLVIDIVIDFVWAHPGVSSSDQPDLNQRGQQLVGRAAAVAESISGGRGKVRVGDTLWIAEGPDMAADSQVRITAAKATVLVVEPVEPAIGDRSR